MYCIQRHTRFPSVFYALGQLGKPSLFILYLLNVSINLQRWIQFPEAWRCYIHLFKQIYLSVNLNIFKFIRGRPYHNDFQEGDGFCFPESCSDMGWKATQTKKPLLQNKHKNYTLHMHPGTITLMFWGLNLKLKSHLD